MKHLLSLMDLTDNEVVSLLDLADDVKKNPQKYSSRLEGICIALLFRKTSTRTRVSFQNGMYQLGGNAIYLDWLTTNLHLGDLSDEIKCMTSYIDLLMARVYKQETLEIMKRASRVPLINGLSDKYHPCQILSDLMTIREKMGKFEDVKLAYIGDGNNVCNSLIIGCTKTRVKIAVASPKGYKPAEDVVEWVRANNKLDFLSLHDDPVEAIQGADCVYTDTFISMGQEAETELRLKTFKPYQINKQLLNKDQKNPFIMHCLPAHRGVEITDEVLDSGRSIVFEQAENRLHLQKALMLRFLEKA